MYTYVPCQCRLRSGSFNDIQNDTPTDQHLRLFHQTRTKIHHMIIVCVKNYFNTLYWLWLETAYTVHVHVHVHVGSKSTNASCCVRQSRVCVNVYIYSVQCSSN